MQSFAAFLARTKNAQPEQYAEALQAAAKYWGLSTERVFEEFRRMKNYIIQGYETYPIQPVSSYLNDDGLPVDCVPFDQQPTVQAAREAGYPIADYVALNTSTGPGVSGPPMALWLSRRQITRLTL